MFLLIILSCKKENFTRNDVEIEFYDFSDKNIETFFEEKNYNLIILNYWATYCSPCKKEMEDFIKLYDKYKDGGLVIVGVTAETKENLELIKKLCKIIKVNYPIIYGAENKFNNEEILGLPTSFIIDKNFNVIEKIDGKRDLDYFINIIEKNIVPKGAED